MTYIELIDAFWDKRAVYPLSSSEADFYFYLLKVCNSRQWINPFKLPTQIIERDLNLNRRTICEIRNKLQQNGYIRYTASTRRGEVTEYEMIDISIDPFGNENTTQTERKTNSNRTQSELKPNAKRTQNERKEAKESSLLSDTKSEDFGLLGERAHVSEEKPKRKRQSDKDPEVVRLNREAKETFMSVYLERFGSPYVWGAADAGQMTNLLSYIRVSRSERKNPLPVDTDSMLDALREFLLAINDYWVLRNYSVKVIASKYNEIISSLKEQKQKSQQYENNSTREKDRRGTPVDESFQNLDYEERF